MTCVYLAFPSSPHTAHLRAEAQRYAQLAWQEGYCPVSPHGLLEFVCPPDLLAAERLDAGAREAIMMRCLELVARCDEIWICGPLLSEGMLVEVAEAKRLGKAVRYRD